jgi:hypothetical protein
MSHALGGKLGGKAAVEASHPYLAHLRKPNIRVIILILSQKSVGGRLAKMAEQSPEKALLNPPWSSEWH